MKPAPFRLTRSRRCRAAAVPWWQGFVLAFALMAVQALGLAHRALHPQAELQGDSAPSIVVAQKAAHWFGHQTDDHGGLTCQLFDQIAHADLHAGIPAAAIAQLPAPHILPQLRGAIAVSASTCAYLARAPPFLG